MTKSRTQMTKLNAKASVLNRIVTLVCNFTCRSVFIKTLGTEYLGVGGMFGNVFSVLSLCELGFGEAASQTMYKPLAENDFATVRSIVRYFSKVYKYIALITLAASSAVMPFLSVMFPDIVNISNYKAVYLLFVLHQTLSYVYAPKRALVMCDQRMYVISLVRTFTVVAVSISQILCLVYTGNYLLYVFLRILFLTLDSIATEKYADKKYGFIKHTVDKELTAKYKLAIKNNTRALAVHRIGGVINNSTDSVLLSACLGLSHMGVYSNYSLIINSLGSFVCLAVSAASASVGNLGASDNSQKSERVLKRLCLANFVLVTNCSSLLLCLINPAIKMWIGEEMCFSVKETAVIIACFYMSYIRDPVQIFLKGYGVFRSTRYIALSRGLLNLVLSYILVQKIGVAGVFAGTFISTLVIPFIAEPYMLFKHGFGTSMRKFFAEYIGYILSSFVICTASYILSQGMNTDTITGIVLKGLAVAGITNGLIFVIYGRNSDFRGLKDLIVKRAK